MEFASGGGLIKFFFLFLWGEGELPNIHFKTHLFFSLKFLGWGTLSSLDPGPKGGSNL